MPGHGREDGVVVRQDNKNLQLISERERENVLSCKKNVNKYRGGKRPQQDTILI